MIDILLSINLLVNSQILYTKDREDYWQTPQETLEIVRGDCEDIAILKWWYAKQEGIPTRLALVRTQQGMHMVVLTKDNQVLDIQEQPYKIVAVFDEDNVWIDEVKQSSEASVLLPKWGAMLSKMKGT